MSELESARKRAESTYNAAADFFDHPANTFWERYGRRTVEQLGLISRATSARRLLWQRSFCDSGGEDRWTRWLGEVRDQVRKQNLDFIQSAAVRSVEANVVYATAIKPV